MPHTALPPRSWPGGRPFHPLSSPLCPTHNRGTPRPYCQPRAGDRAKDGPDPPQNGRVPDAWAAQETVRLGGTGDGNPPPTQHPHRARGPMHVRGALQTRWLLPPPQSCATAWKPCASSRRCGKAATAVTSARPVTPYAPRRRSRGHVHRSGSLVRPPTPSAASLLCLRRSSARPAASGSTAFRKKKTCHARVSACGRSWVKGRRAGLRVRGLGVAAAAVGAEPRPRRGSGGARKRAPCGTEGPQELTRALPLPSLHLRERSPDRIPRLMHVGWQSKPPAVQRTRERIQGQAGGQHVWEGRPAGWERGGSPPRGRGPPSRVPTQAVGAEISGRGACHSPGARGLAARASHTPGICGAERGG